MAAEVICISFSLESTLQFIFLENIQFPMLQLICISNYNCISQAGFSSGHISLYEISDAHPVFTIKPLEQTRQSLLRVLFSPNNPTVFYTIHSHGQLLIWDLAKSKNPESINDLNLKDDSEAIGFSNGEVQLHGLSNLSINYEDRKRNTSLSSAIKIFKDL
uniref:Uncharacterized protein n=1 Tax=Onchocerca volvulus TaxID=6282 RepID=A0A8R1Y5B0_ONCVO